jgi:hypothetical protein
MSEPLHPAFCEWLQRNRARMSREAFEAGQVVARWLFLAQSDVAPPDVWDRAAPALREFRERYAECQPPHP